PATSGRPLTQGSRFRKDPRSRKRKFRAEIAEEITLFTGSKSPCRRSARAQVEGLHVSTSRQFLDALHDLLAMMKKFVADDGMTGEDDEPVPLDHRRVRVHRVGLSHDFLPMIANRVLR